MIEIKWYGIDRTLGGVASAPGVHAQFESLEGEYSGFNGYFVSNRLQHFRAKNLSKLGMQFLLNLWMDEYKFSSRPVRFAMPSFWCICTAVGNSTGWTGDTVNNFGQIWLHEGPEAPFLGRTVAQWLAANELGLGGWLRMNWALGDERG